jgi:hypothetical protein
MGELWSMVLPEVWTAAGLVLALIGVATAMPSLPESGWREFRVAQCCFVGATLLFLLKLGSWGSREMTYWRLKRRVGPLVDPLASSPPFLSPLTSAPGRCAIMVHFDAPYQRSLHSISIVFQHTSAASSASRFQVGIWQVSCTCGQTNAGLHLSTKADRFGRGQRDSEMTGEIQRSATVGCV